MMRNTSGISNVLTGIVSRPVILSPARDLPPKPIFPTFPVGDSFRGPSHHTAHWPQDGLDLTHQRVGVIGTGASGVQVIQEAGKVASHLTVFQRTPNIALPMQQQKFSRQTLDTWKAEYPEIFQKRDASGGGLHDVEAVEPFCT